MFISTIESIDSIDHSILSDNIEDYNLNSIDTMDSIWLIYNGGNGTIVLICLMTYFGSIVFVFVFVWFYSL